MGIIMRLMTKESVQVVNRFNRFFKSLNECLVKRDRVVTQLSYAVATGEHILLEGKPGVAKSYFANLFLNNITDAHTFTVQCTKKMSEDYLVGPLDMKKFKEEGVMVHRVYNTIVDCDYAFVDEIFDLSAGAIRGLLQILNEREFTRGAQHEYCSLKTCIAATNFNKEEEEELEAVLDRFMYRAEVHGLTNDGDKLNMLKLRGEMEQLHVEDLDTMQQLVSDVEVPDKVLGYYVDVISKLPKVTDRKLRKGVKVMQARAAIEGRTRCITSDITACEFAFSTIGNSASQSDFGVAMQTYTKIAGAIDDELKANVIYNQITKISIKLKPELESSKTVYKSISKQVEEVVTLKHLAKTKLNNGSSIRSSILALCDKILLQVDNIRERELTA